jgi:Zn ribbon nucleic-acid-binding protein
MENYAPMADSDVTRPLRIRTRSCPLCGASSSSDARPWFARDGWRIISCHACGFAYLPEVPKPGRAG